MIASDVMSRNVISVPVGANIRDAVRLMLSKRISGLLVLDADGSPAGILTEGDLLRRFELGTERHRFPFMEFIRGSGQQAADYVHTRSRKVDDVMTRDLITVEESASLETVVQLMENHEIKRIPVVRDGRCVGLVSRADLLRFLLPALEDGGSHSASDDEILGKLIAMVNSQAWAPSESLRLSCSHGVVTLAGVIRDERERGALRVIAGNIPGVQRVVDELISLNPPPE